MEEEGPSPIERVEKKSLSGKRDAIHQTLMLVASIAAAWLMYLFAEPEYLKSIPGYESQLSLLDFGLLVLIFLAPPLFIAGTIKVLLSLFLGWTQYRREHPFQVSYVFAWALWGFFIVPQIMPVYEDYQVSDEVFHYCMSQKDSDKAFCANITLKLRHQFYLCRQKKEGVGHCKSLALKKLHIPNTIVAINNSTRKESRERQDNTAPFVSAKISQNCKDFFIKEDYKKAFPHCEKAAKAYDHEAMFRLGYMYHMGFATNQNFHLAKKWYLKAAKGNISSAMYNLAIMAEEGEGGPRSDKKARQWYRKAMKLGYLSAMNNLGVMYLNGYGGDKDINQALRLFVKAADKGHAKSMFNLGLVYSLDDPQYRNLKKALYWYNQAAKKNYKGAKERAKEVAALMKGRKVKTKAVPPTVKVSHRGQCHDLYEAGNYDKAFAYCLKAAHEKHPLSMFRLGYMYDIGKGTKKDITKAKHWYELAAQDDIPAAIYNLGYMYQHGEGVNVDLNKARALYLRSADLGLLPAMYRLAQMLIKGEGGSRDYLKAKYWHTLAAKNGFGNSMYKLAGMYERGLGTNRDKEKALFWYEKAAKKNIDNAKEKVKALKMILHR